MTCDGRGEGRVSSMDKIIHVVCFPHGALHLLHGFLHLVHFSLQVWYPASDGTSGLVSFFDTIFRPSIF